MWKTISKIMSSFFSQQSKWCIFTSWRSPLFFQYMLCYVVFVDLCPNSPPALFTHYCLVVHRCFGTEGPFASSAGGTSAWSDMLASLSSRSLSSQQVPLWLVNTACQSKQTNLEPTTALRCQMSAATELKGTPGSAKWLKWLIWSVIWSAWWDKW